MYRIFVELLYNTCLPGSKHRLLRSKTCGSRYALERVRLISVASSFPPRPSNSGVAFAEQSTKNSILPSFGLPGSGTSIGGFELDKKIYHICRILNLIL